MMCAKFGIIVIAKNDLAMGGRDLWITLYMAEFQTNKLGFNKSVFETKHFKTCLLNFIVNSILNSIYTLHNRHIAIIIGSKCTGMRSLENIELPFLYR